MRLMTHLALLPALGRPREHVIGVEPVQRQDQTPSAKRDVEPGRARHGGIDQEENEHDAGEDREMREEGAHRPHPSPRPLLDLGDPCLLAERIVIASAPPRSATVPAK
jgi:hypothetical protein